MIEREKGRRNRCTGRGKLYVQGRKKKHIREGEKEMKWVMAPFFNNNKFNNSKKKMISILLHTLQNISLNKYIYM